MVRQFITYYLISLLISSNIGIPVFTHICHSQAKSWSSICLPAKTCCTKKNSGDTIKPCHPSPIKNGSGIKSRPCCENHSALVQLGVDFITKHTVNENSLQIPFINNTLAFECFDPTTFFSSCLSSNKPHGPPLFLYGRSLLIFEQLFLC